MIVKELLEQEIDIDVYDNVCEELCIAFVGPLYLTQEGQKEFSDVLELNVKLDKDMKSAQIKVNGQTDKWLKTLRHAERFFSAAAGYCSEENYDKWFKDKEG